MSGTIRKQQGFTIVELLIVIVVIGILAAITIVAYNGIQKRAQAADQKVVLRHLSQEAAILKLDGASPMDASFWKQALINTGLFDVTASSDGLTAEKSIMTCANDQHQIIGAWQPYNTTEEEADDVFYTFDGAQKSIDWDIATTGATTLEKFCRQASEANGVDLYTAGLAFRIWMHNPMIRDAPPLE